jgi:predicted DCC family thiol-disulfide oxidoreductase YuxK
MTDLADGGAAPKTRRADTHHPAGAHLATGGAVVLFDGVCNLCNASVLFVIDRDPRGRFAFAPLQSEAAARLLAKRGYRGAGAGGAPGGVPGAALSSVLLVEGDRVYERSTAALRVARRLAGAWPLLYAFVAVPRPIRDTVYDWIARNRYRWFGKGEACRIPTPELRARFVG